MSRIIISQAKTIAELSKLAALEEAGDDILYVSKFGKSGILTANVQESVWSVGGDRTLLFTSQTISIVSTSGEDDSTGTGAQVILIQGLDGNYDILQETIIMDGTTPVLTTNKFLRIERMVVLAAGSNHSNVGTITATETGGSTIQARIEIGRSQTQMAMITIPRGYTGLTTMSLISCHRSSGTGVKRGELEVVATTSTQVEIRLQTFGMVNDGTSTFFGEYNLPFVTPEKTEAHYSFTAESSGTYCSVVFNILFVKGNWNTNDNTLF